MAVAAAGATRQVTLDHYTTIDSHPRDNGWGEHAQQQPIKQQDINESNPALPH